MFCRQWRCCFCVRWSHRPTLGPERRTIPESEPPFHFPVEKSVWISGPNPWKDRRSVSSNDAPPLRANWQKEQGQIMANMCASLNKKWTYEWLEWISRFAFAQFQCLRDGLTDLPIDGRTWLRRDVREGTKRDTNITSIRVEVKCLTTARDFMEHYLISSDGLAVLTARFIESRNAWWWKEENSETI